MIDLRLVDGLGPFFVPVRRRRLNWSKIAFHDDLPMGEGSEEVWRKIAFDLAEFAERVKKEGFNVFTLGDVAHITGHPWYEDGVAGRIAFFSARFKELIGMLRAKGLRVYLTSDVVTLSAGVPARLAGSRGAKRAFYLAVLRRFFRNFTEVKGVILRIGESGGRDVHDELRSELHLRSRARPTVFCGMCCRLWRDKGRP